MSFSLPTWALALVVFGAVVLNVPKAPLLALEHGLAEPPPAAAP